MMLVRLATSEDIPQLVQMRWDFSEEEHANSVVTFEEFNQICSEFLLKAIQSGDWYIWIAESGGSLVSHMYLQLIHKVPRPGKSSDPYYGYVTNVYTRPAFRNLGIGSKIIMLWKISQKRMRSSFSYFGQATRALNSIQEIVFLRVKKR